MAKRKPRSSTMKDEFEEGATQPKPESTRERSVEKPCKTLAESHGWLVRKHRTPGHNGAPDDWFAKNGRIFFVEFKAPDKEPRLDQIIQHNAMRAAGLTVYVIDNKEDFNRILMQEELLAAAN